VLTEINFISPRPFRRGLFRISWRIARTTLLSTQHEETSFLDETLAKTIHVPGNRNLRDQIQVPVSNGVMHTRQKSVIMPLPKTETEHG
jgi:hypothetical protein